MKKSHLTLVDSSNPNPNPKNLTYEQVEDKILCMMDVLDLVQTLNLEDEFPHLEKQVKQLIELQESLEVTPPPPPEEETQSNVVDMEAFFMFKKFQNEKKRKEEEFKNALPSNVVLLKSGTDDDAS